MFLNNFFFMIMYIVYGKAINVHEKAKTILALMLVSLFAGPICKVTADFQRGVMKDLKKSYMQVVQPLGLIMDSCSGKQKTFQHFQKFYFLLNDTVHILNFITNNLSEIIYQK